MIRTTTTTTILCIFFILCIRSSCTSQTRSYYLLDLDTNFSSCSTISINKTRYGIPHLCQKHLLCHRSHCDERSFRCVKIRETLCCLLQYIDQYCSTNRVYKDQFRSIYFHMSIEHGYCEINLERIEQKDPSYCLTNQFETTTSMQYHQHRNVISQETTTNLPSSTSSVIRINSIVLLLTIIFSK